MLITLERFGLMRRLVLLSLQLLTSIAIIFLRPASVPFQRENQVTRLRQRTGLSAAREPTMIIPFLDREQPEAPISTSMLDACAKL